VSTDNGNTGNSSIRELRASITSVEARLAIVAAGIRAELVRRRWQWIWPATRAFVGSVKSSIGK